jgi:hypothetical protein
MVLVLVYLSHLTALQIMAFNHLTLGRMIYLGWNKPLKDKKSNNMLIFGEVIVLLTNYHLFVFTDFTKGVKGK